MPHDSRPENPEHETTAAQAVDACLARLAERRARPLIRLQERLPDGRVAVEVFDRSRPGDHPLYDFYCGDHRSALEWLAQMAPKTWITKDHLETFARLMLAEFGKAASRG